MENNFNHSFWLQEKHISFFGNHPKIEEITKLQFYPESISFSIDKEFIYGLGAKEIFQYNLKDSNIQTFHLPLEIEKTSIVLSNMKCLFLIAILGEIQKIYQFDTETKVFKLITESKDHYCSRNIISLSKNEIILFGSKIFQFSIGSFILFN
jgi:hypothetical protein